MKSLWNGSLSFGLVTIAIQIISAVKPHALGFKVLCGHCKTPLSYERWCRHCNKEVAWANTVKGLEIKKGTFFIIDTKVLRSLRLEKTDTITIDEFVDHTLIDPIYYEKHYYIVPTKKSEKAYFLFKKALESTQKSAIGTFVMRDREHVCAINAYEEGLLLSTLNYSYEIIPLSNIALLQRPPSISTHELKLAQQLIGQRTVKTFNISEYKDSYALKLAALLKKGTTIKALPRGAKKITAPSDNHLLENLKKSLQPLKTSSKAKKVSRKVKKS